MVLTPFFMAVSLFFQIRKMQKQQAFDVIDAHYFYPDGVAVALVSKLLKFPFIVSARGTDINLIPEYKIPRRMILWAAKQAQASVTVCKALKDTMVEIGAEANKIYVYRNGVDLDFFKLLDKPKCRENQQLTKKTLVSVGHLIERKGHHLIIEAMKSLPDYQLLIVGGGEEEASLKKLVAQFKLSDNVRFLGEKKQNELVEIYNAADAMVLASSREGWANVLLESLACGTPVVATDIWGTPEVVQNLDAGVLVKRTPESIAQGVKKLFNHYPQREITRKYAEQFSWDSTTQGLLKLFSKVKGTAEQRS
jgi:glycosyltransferase involved in cell wall biosynthesis